MAEIKQFRINTSDKRTLAKNYNVSLKEFNTMIAKKFPEIKNYTWNKALYPKQVGNIFEYLKKKKILPIVSDLGRSK